VRIKVLPSVPTSTALLVSTCRTLISKENPHGFFRVRYLGPLPGFAGLVKKPDRFTQEIRALNEVYLPPLFGRPWEELAGDASIILYITEGELKAAAG